MDPRKKKKKSVIVAVLSVSIVTLVLGLGLGLGLDLHRCRNKVVPQTSCRGRCWEPFGESPGCSCDSGCVNGSSSSGSSSSRCCSDFQGLCLQPTESWECTALRCGESRSSRSRCQCSDDCLSTGDCCTNYRRVCHGEKSWLEERQCDDLSTPHCPQSFKNKQPLLLVSLDGLRAEYSKTWSHLIPVLDKLRRCGTSAPFMQSAFPSKTFPNHYTIVTGLYPESNGLVDNSMYDPELDASFSLSSPEKDNPAWYLGQPVWLTAQYAGLKSGTFFWPGSDVKVNGSFPNIYRPYNGKTPFEERVFTVLQWLQLPQEERPDFYTLYLEEPDKSGHSYGPVSGGLLAALQGVDRVMGQLMDGLKQIGLDRCLNVIVVADHGMEETSCDRKEALQELVGDVSRYWVNEGPFGRIRARDKDAVIDWAGLVANMTCKKPGQKTRPYLKTQLPKRLHFANSRRIEDVNILVEPKWLLERFPGSLKFCSGGNHGYDNDVESMHAMFLSYGPKFWSGVEVEPFANIELYNLMCDLLDVPPAVNNGTHGSMNHLLRAPPHRPAPPRELSPPARCPLLGLDPEDALGCVCGALVGTEANARLNLSSEQEAAAQRQHLPWGRPRLLQPSHSSCLLLQEAFVSSYSRRHRQPLWTSYTLEAPVTSDPLPPVVPDCVRADVRLQPWESPRCDQEGGGLSRAFLYPPNLNSSVDQQFDALLVSNVVPMFPAFKRVWTFLHEHLLLRFSSLYNGVNVVSGPAFDYNYDGQWDEAQQIQQSVPGTNVSVPTHFFLVLSSCGNSSVPVTSCDGELQSVSFLLPHRDDNSESCRSSEEESSWVEELLWFHQSRVRDVEWITGLDFFQGSHRPMEELLRLKTRPTAAVRRRG